MRSLLVISLSILYLHFQAQVNLGGFVKERAAEARDKAKDKTRDKFNENIEKQRREYDESNFNYAICFLDNSGSFESEEKGSALGTTFTNLNKLTHNEEKTTEERAYTSLRNGELLMAGNRFHLAEQSLKLSKFLYEEDGKKETENYAQVISDLGLLYQSTGRYSSAGLFDQQALELRSKLPNEGMLLVSENNLAVLQKETGNYNEAESRFRKCILSCAKLNDKLALALVKNNLAMTYLEMNKLRDAEDQMHTSLSEASTVLKPNSSNFIKLQINLACVYRFEKKFQSAEELYLRAISIKEKKLGAHPDLATLKKGLAQLYMDMGKNVEAEKLLLSALEINKKKLGENNPATISTQQELGNYYRFSGSAQKSLDLLIKVSEKKKSIYGESHPAYIQSLEDLSLTKWELGQKKEAVQGYRAVIEHTLDYIHNFFKALNEAEKSAYWDKTNSRLQRYFFLLISEASMDDALVKELLNTVMSTKGFLLNGSQKLRKRILENPDTTLRSLFAEWIATREQVGRGYQLSKEELNQEKVNLDSLEKRANEIEKSLSQKSSLFREAVDEKPVISDDIKKTLAANEAAIDVLEVNEYNNGFTGGQKYFAFIQRSRSLKVVQLGDGATIKDAIKAFRENTLNRKQESAAYDVTWKTVDAELQGITKIYLSLDGDYHQLSILGLKDNSGKYLADKYTIQFASNTRDVPSIKMSDAVKMKPESAVLLANPLYGKNGMVDQLPGTETEVKNVNKLLVAAKIKSVALYSEKATEKKVKEVNSPSILHIATHGYFLDDVSQVESGKLLGIDLGAAKENPLLRSGLLFANCENVFDEGFRPDPNAENGVLTAFEAMSLNLDKTDLVVLSACETGLGSVKQGEGVYGLQRAFLIAGAKSLIMSLWTVSDEATMQLMTLFYTNYIKTGNKNQAFSDAIRLLKTKFKEPYYWAAFVMLSR
jgi:CHAT domain-containing protein